ncbi:PAP2 superfamily protein [Cyclobacterium lianum]|uniref:PAP2 superfamily protein n=1 Tax=Cyclobacterium lianum TaxID=388280 RepID=A0A1M7QSB0_9BACT|nr:vanadium-dependent haloperoxidase [Cyclobacterium lianum]SHN34530.1 PAP2 superfamily protein [Cyclobacterium lianum]
MSGKLSTLCVLLLLLSGSRNSFAGSDGGTSLPPPKTQEVAWMVDHLFSITEVMVTDVASPPGAARFYSYSLLAAYLVIQDVENPQQERLLRHLNAPLPGALPLASAEQKAINTSFSAIYAMLEVGKKIMPSGKNLTASQEKLIGQFVKNRMLRKKDVSENVQYAEQVANLVLQYAKNDGYAQLSTLKRYSPSSGDGKWYPTPPAYLPAIDPEWRTIRPFFISDAAAFAPKPPAAFSMDPGSSFYRQVHEVYTVTSGLTDEQRLIANFWDCNPFNVSYSGHMAIGLKKISPGGHWMGITGIAALKAGLDLKNSIFIHTLVAMGLHDAFISCWDEKYRSDRIRPITVINEHIDQSWRPILQTPPFPEYTSGHSVISRASAIILSSFFGNDFSFVDTSEVFFGLPERAFDSFIQASEEAAISRLYGGIHYRDAIEVGMKQGEAIALHILEKIDPAKERLLSEEN